MLDDSSWFDEVEPVWPCEQPALAVRTVVVAIRSLQATQHRLTLRDLEAFGRHRDAERYALAVMRWQPVH